MKRFICLFLSAVFIFESLNIANAEEQIKEEYYNINVEFSDARSETEQIQIMLKNNNIYNESLCSFVYGDFCYMYKKQKNFDK